MAITQEVSSVAPEPPAEIVARPETAGRLVLVAIGWLLLTALVSGVLVGVPAGVLKHTYFPNASVVSVVGVTVMMFFACCILLIAVRRRSVAVGQGNRRAGVGDAPITRWWLLVVLVFATAIWAFVACAVLNALRPRWIYIWRDESAWTLMAFSAVAVILAPLSEELFYRGWLWTGLRRHWRAFPTALLSCSLWRLSHIERGMLFTMIIIPVAIILGFARHFCGIRASIALHAVYNLVTVLLLALLLTSP